jgi:branched-chain amino acid transport system permease protein
MGVDAILNGVAIGGVYALIASGLALIYGVMHVINLAHTEMVMVGGYLAYVLSVLSGVPILLAAGISLVAVAALGLGIDRALIRPFRQRRLSDDERLLSTVIVTFGLSYLLANGVYALMGADVRKLPEIVTGQFTVFGSSIANQQVLIIIASLVSVGGLFAFLRFTRWGMGIRAVSQNPEAAQIAGVNRDLTYGMTFAIASLLAALAGILIGPVYYLFPYMGFSYLAKAFLLIILGGLGSIEGALVVAFALGIAESVIGTYVSTHVGTMVFFGLAIAVLAVRPGGLFGRQARTV